MASRRIRYERERRGWSTAELARRVTEAGYRINQSSVWAIESGEPRRKISLGEAVAFANVFDLDLDELMTVPDERRESFQALLQIVRGMNELKADSLDLLVRVRGSVDDLQALRAAAMPALEYLDQAGLGPIPSDDLQDVLAEAAGLLMQIRDELAAHPIEAGQTAAEAHK